LTDTPLVARSGIDDQPAATLEHVDQEVAKTLGELELKLQELEHELTSLGHHDTPAHQVDTLHEQANAPGTNTPGKLIDEAVERDLRQESDTRERTAAEAIADGDGFGGPAVWGGEEVPAQAGATSEREWTVEVRETAYGEIPIPPPQAPDAQQATWPPAPVSHHSPPSPHISAAPQTPPSPNISAAPHVSAASQEHSFAHVPAPPHTQPVPHHPYAATPTERQSVDIADLVEFKEKMQRTLDGLIAEYSRLLSPKPPA
jgi:hypothetical protein